MIPDGLTMIPDGLGLSARRMEEMACPIEQDVSNTARPPPSSVLKPALIILNQRRRGCASQQMSRPPEAWLQLAERDRGFGHRDGSSGIRRARNDGFREPRPRDHREAGDSLVRNPARPGRGYTDRRPSALRDGRSRLRSGRNLRDRDGAAVQCCQFHSLERHLLCSRERSPGDPWGLQSGSPRASFPVSSAEQREGARIATGRRSAVGRCRGHCTCRSPN
jgi:hypothetical protein